MATYEKIAENMFRLSAAPALLGRGRLTTRDVESSGIASTSGSGRLRSERLLPRLAAVLMPSVCGGNSTAGEHGGRMAKSRDDDLWVLAHAERTAGGGPVGPRLPSSWRHATLCGQWDVEEVVAHLTAAASLNQWRWVWSMLGVFPRRRAQPAPDDRASGQHPRRGTPRPIPRHPRQHHRPVGTHPGLPWRGCRARPRHPSAAGNAADAKRRRPHPRGCLLRGAPKPDMSKARSAALPMGECKRSSAYVGVL